MCQDYIGKVFVDDTMEIQGIQGQNIVFRSELPHDTRILKKDSVITLEFNANRLNLRIDDNNIIVQQFYG